MRTIALLFQGPWHGQWMSVLSDQEEIRLPMRPNFSYQDAPTQLVASGQTIAAVYTRGESGEIGNGRYTAANYWFQGYDGLQEE